MLKALLKERNLPPLTEREKMLELIQREVYGYMPPLPDKLTWTVEENTIPNFCAGKANCDKVTLTSKIGDKEFSFPVYAVIPKGKKNIPFFIHINFRPDVPDRYMPTEEIIDNGFAVLSFCYHDVTRDISDFTNGFSGVLFPDGKRGDSDPGKIALWAWAAHRVMDYAETIDVLDKNTSCVCGHSRLGKTALLTAATDERFKFAYSNDSGCGGAAITRGKIGEHISDSIDMFPYWYCENYKKYVNNEDAMPTDQHFVTALIAPRFVFIGSAEEDLWADPVSEMLNCVAVSEVYEKMGKKGFIAPDRLPVAGDVFDEGTVGYHLRSGLHYFSREDWIKLMGFVNKHREV